MKTKVPYPQVIRRSLEALKLTATLNGVRQAASILKSREAVKLRIGSGEYAHCIDEDQIDAHIADKVLQKYPQLQPVIDDFREEGCGYGTLCLWLNDFLEDVGWLAGNRPWVAEYLPVKNFQSTGVLALTDAGYVVYEHGPEKEVCRYSTAFEAVLDGWKVD